MAFLEKQFVQARIMNKKMTLFLGHSIRHKDWFTNVYESNNQAIKMCMLEEMNWEKCQVSFLEFKSTDARVMFVLVC